MLAGSDTSICKTCGNAVSADCIGHRAASDICERAEKILRYKSPGIQRAAMKDLIHDFIAELKSQRADNERLRNALIDGAVDSYCREKKVSKR